jgi:3-phenylpropionate/trans-cinnamate dioxygenase ferredoxin component
MSNLVEAGKDGELAKGSMKTISVEGREILLAKVGDKYYAVDSRCPHMGGKLAQGKLEGVVVTCPRHKAQFDLSDGHVIRWAEMPGVASVIGKAIKRPHPLTTYVVKIERDSILVEI